MNKSVVLIGAGCPRALAENICQLGIPVLTTWMAADLVPEDSPVFCGRPGIFGQRAANIIQQKADRLLVLGARLDGEQVAYNYENFAPNAHKVVYDIDQAELDKLPGDWEKICADLHFVSSDSLPDQEWLTWCKSLYARFRYELDGGLYPESDKFVDPFRFTSLLSAFSAPDDVLAIGSSGNAPTVFYQSYKVKAGQRISNVCTIGAMGADIPMALGAAMATGRRTICITGDGGFQMNTQELETIRRLRLPVIFFVMNNNGYNSIRVMQKGRFEGRIVGSDPKSGFTLPDLEAIADAYRFSYMQLRGADLPAFARCFGMTPMIVEVFVDPEWSQLPRTMTSVVNGVLQTDPMENMTPKLDPGELAQLMAYEPER